MRRFFKNLSSIVIALILATLVWVVAINEQNPPREENYLQNIPVEVIPPAEGLITTDKLPEFVRLRLRAPESSWLDLPPSKFKATLDLSELSVGFNDVPINMVASDSEIEIIETKPQKVSVNLQVEQAITLPVTVDIMDTLPLGYDVNRDPEADPDQVAVKGPASLVDQAQQAAVEVYIGGAKETIERMGDVIVRDRDGRPVSGVKVQPAQVRITLPIEQKFGYKEVSVSPVVVGQVAPGYRVSSISTDPPTLTVVGNPDVLSSIPGFIETAQVDLNQATETMQRTVPLNLPNGVNIIFPDREEKGPGGVQVTIEIAAIEDGIILQRPVTQQGIGIGYWWKSSPERVDVFLSGPVPQLQTLKASDVEVIVDLFDLEPGVHKLKPTVFLPDNFRVDAVLPDTVEVTIGSGSTPTPTIAPTPTVGVSRFVPNTPTPLPGDTIPSNSNN